MKRKLTEKYMVIFSISVIMVVVVWMLLVFLLIFSEQEAVMKEPRNIVNYFQAYYDKNDMEITEEGKEMLLRNDMWVQIIDDYGNILDEYNVPADVPRKYDIFEMNKCLFGQNDDIPYTYFLVQLRDNNDYGVVVGCDKSKISKLSIKIDGGLTANLTKIGVIFIVVFIVGGVCAGLYFSKNISEPVNEIIHTINKLETEENCEMIESKKSIFKSVVESLENLRKRLASADEARKYAEKQRNEWISNISHDMKTPLTAIMGYSEVMMYSQFQTSEESRMLYCEKIYKHAESISELVEELKFSRLLENGQIGLNVETVNIPELLEDCSYDIPSNYDSERISYEFENHEICADIDRLLIKRCFVNIICNAIVHNMADVDIIIRCRQEEKAVIEIEDNGKGMGDEDKKKVFTRYYRGKESKKVSGSGLGLAIANDIIKVHGGSIEVESELGVGTKFIIKL